MPVEVTVTSGTVADSSQADKLISEIEGQYLLADRAYDTNYVLYLVAYKGMEAVIPAKRNRKKKRKHKQEVYENPLSSGEDVSENKTLAWHCYSICEKHNLNILHNHHVRRRGHGRKREHRRNDSVHRRQPLSWCQQQLGL